MKKTLTLISLLLLCFFSQFCNVIPHSSMKATKGVLDLKEWNYQNNELIKLEGEWEFYWKEWITPQNCGFVNKEETSFISLPQNWNGYVWKGKTLGSDGYASYRLCIQLPEDAQEIWIRSYEQATAYKVFANGSLVLESGQIGKTSNEHSPHTTSTIGAISHLKGNLELVMYISNFTHRRGGVWHSLRLGTSKAALRDMESRKSMDIFVSGCLFMLGFYYLATFLIRNKEQSALIFTLFSFSFLGRVVAVQEKIILILIPNLSYISYVRLDYMSIFLSVGLGYHYIYLFFPIEKSKFKLFLIYGLSLGTALFCLLTPVKIFSYTVYLFYLYFLFTFLLGLIHIFKAAHQKVEGAFLFLLGFSVFCILIINDILFTAQIIRTGYYAGIGIIIFMFALAFGLAKRLLNAFNNVELLSENIRSTNESFQKFVPSEFIRLLEKESIATVKLGDHKTSELSILFSDIRSFTSLAEKMTPEECFKFLNIYLGRIGPVIRKNNGFIDKYIGDGVMALFPGSVDNALQAAIDIQKEIFQWNQIRKIANESEIRAGVGIHKGETVIGIIGENQRIDGTVIADAVNLASRIEALTKVYDASILISSEAFFEVEDPMEYNFRFLDTVKVKGKESKVTVVEIMDGKTEAELTLFFNTKLSFETGLNHFNMGDYNTSISYFEDVLRVNPSDIATKLYLKRCQDFLRKNIYLDPNAKA
jgi:adenylate cyclase